MRTIRLVLGSVIVYVVVAACGAGAGSNLPDRSDASGSSASSSGTMADAISSALDAVTDPVSEAAADTNQSGSRIKVKFYAGDDGSKAFLGLYDSQRQEDCTFSLASDGTTRCLPGGLTTGSYFADSACTTKLALSFTTSCTTPKYATVTSVSCPSGGAQIFQLGAPFTGTAYGSTGTSCVVTTIPGTFLLYSIGSEVPPGSFVSATSQTAP